MNVSNVKKLNPKIILIYDDLTIINFGEGWPFRN